MKQMTLIEMDGFLKGKCIPRDLKVNETNAEYLVRKFAEAEAKCAALAAENAVIKSAIPEPRDIEDDNDNMDDVSLAEDFGFNHAIELMRRRIPETPATDAFLAEVRAQGVDTAIEHLHKKFKGTVLVGVPVMALEYLAAELRKGGNQ
ncbi:TPA: hypothetical protein KEY04_003626 [Escherichia coli]|nr:hypothetical protein [Escherichia coli]HBC7121586.1 hypothetical protein [Escherichia coli]